MSRKPESEHGWVRIKVVGILTLFVTLLSVCIMTIISVIEMM